MSSRMEAANRIYAEFWGRNLDELLQPVSASGDFKYLTQKHTVLKKLLYKGDVLLVRDLVTISGRITHEQRCLARVA